MSHLVLVTGCSQLLTLRGPVPRRGRALQDPGIIRNGALLVSDGIIVAIGTDESISRIGRARRAKRLNLGGRVVTPGLVDSHTHLVFAHSRVEDYAEQIIGKTYEQIARAGGGILSSVRALRAATASALKERARADLVRFAAHGTTTVEAKSGYGLDALSELKTLRILRELHQEQALDIVPTFLGAHVVPPEFRGRPDDYVDFLARLLIPQVALEGLAEFCDVYCDRGAFSVSQARRILTTGRECGLSPRLHAEQLSRSGAAKLAVETGAASADHLENVSPTDIRALAHSNVVATLLPGCDFHHGTCKYAPARALIKAGAAVALATDYNPGTSPTLNLPMILSIACSQMRMTPAEAIAAATINPAFSLRRHRRIGSLEVGKYADLAVFDVADYREIPYYFGVNHCWMTIKQGDVIHSSAAIAG